MEISHTFNKSLHIMISLGFSSHGIGSISIASFLFQKLRYERAKFVQSYLLSRIKDLNINFVFLFLVWLSTTSFLCYKTNSVVFNCFIQVSFKSFKSFLFFHMHQHWFYFGKCFIVRNFVCKTEYHNLKILTKYILLNK